MEQYSREMKPWYSHNIIMNIFDKTCNRRQKKLKEARTVLSKMRENDLSESLSMIYALQCLGIDYHFQDDIKAVLENIIIHLLLLLPINTITFLRSLLAFGCLDKKVTMCFQVDYIAATNEFKEIFVPLAKFDFNMLQLFHREELAQFSKWKTDASKALPDHTKTCFTVLYYITNETAYNIYQELGYNPTCSLQKADEDTDGNCGSYTKCYREENPGISEEDARKHVMNRISDTWKQLTGSVYFQIHSIKLEKII
ncbi:hypothetical protein RCOM_1576510 [Ricinus communis]|uniref:Terpene synthase N-terminal domain-containing protein n=1 Tax=Ricinus communis TaxID=3988 RepID=B9RI56_RICCO|nr:hypothetical protein RCOM_1576510 [Ricinus communis]